MRILPEIVELVELADGVTIQASLAGTDIHEHLAGLILLSDAIHGINPKVPQVLQLPYLPYSRGDRRFVDGDCHGLATFGAMLSAGEFKEVRTLDVHHFAHANMFIDNLVNVMPRVEILRAIVDFEDYTGTKPVILFPDAGAARRYKNCIPADLTVLYADKKRDAATGKLTGFTVPIIPGSAALIIDDLCDGGGTFLGIASAVRHAPKLGLYVTHGVFSQGIQKLASRFGGPFERIYATDSVHSPSNLPGVKIWSALQALNDTDNPVSENAFSKAV